MAQEHYFSAEPTTNSKETAVEFEVAGQLFQLSATSGTFSSTALDTGTNVLLSHSEKFPSSGNVLDLGCGWGPIAVSIAALRPDTTVWALDVNERSLATTSKNAKIFGQYWRIKSRVTPNSPESGLTRRFESGKRYCTN
jgi:16S rRNA (guanine1207-N2)-methyltransferase